MFIIIRTRSRTMESGAKSNATQKALVLGNLHSGQVEGIYFVT